MSLLFNLCVDNQQSNTGQNIEFLKNLYNVNSLQDPIEEKHSIKKNRVNPLEQGEEWKPILINEICLAKKGFLDIGLEEEILDDLLLHIYNQ